MNKYIPQKDMTILIREQVNFSHQTKNMFGIITNIINNQITVARLDECGKIIIDINSDWEPIDVLDPKILHHCYNTFIGKNVTNIFVNNYEAYKNRYINKK